jgi:hypothetical protein
MQTGHAGYLRFLAERDGTPNFGRRTLSRRETFFAALDAAPLRSTTPIDRAAYLRNLDRRRPEPGLEPRLLWLLATARANQAERFGVGLGELYGRVTPESDPVRLHVTLRSSGRERWWAAWRSGCCTTAALRCFRTSRR